MKNKISAMFMLLMYAVSISIICWPVILFASERTPDRPPYYSDLQNEVFQKANAKFGIWSGYAIFVNPRGVIYEIKTDLINNGLTANEPVERSYQFFEAQKDLFQIPDPRKELVVTGVVRNDSGSGVIHFDQQIGNVKVYQGGCFIRYDSSSAGVQLRRFYCDNQYNGLLPDAHNIDPVPALDSLDAICIAQSDPAHGERKTYVMNLGLWMGNDFYFGIRPFPDKRTHLFWHIYVGGGGYQGGAEYFIDAYSGEILYVDGTGRW